jgi:hypothetical protein
MAAMALLPRLQRGHHRWMEFCDLTSFHPTQQPSHFFTYCCINFELISALECVSVCYFAGRQDLKTECGCRIALQTTDVDAI